MPYPLGYDGWVGVGGLEPPTSSLSGTRSNQSELHTIGKCGRIRTHIFRLWRPVFFQLNYANTVAVKGVEPSSVGLWGQAGTDPVHTASIVLL